MKTWFSQVLVGLIIGLLMGASPLWAQGGDSESYITVSGIVKDKRSKKTLENVNINLPSSNVGTVTNADGEFTLKIRTDEGPSNLIVSHIGYVNEKVRLNAGDVSGLTIWLTPHANLLHEVVVFGSNPRILVEEALKKVAVNYSSKSNMLTGFYRETVQKRKRYISIAEAVVDVYKTPYTSRQVDSDRVQILKGRRLLSQKTSDTLAVKLVGGPNLSIYLDVVKNPDALFDSEELGNYDFWFEESANIDNRLQYVIGFKPRVIEMYALFYGKMYIDRERLSITRAEFNLDMANKTKAIHAILKKKPFGLRFKPQEMSFLVTYKEYNGVSYLNYIRNDIRFKCDWKRRLFSTSYTVLSEMVVTDQRADNVSKISYKHSFDAQEVFYDKAPVSWSDDYWGGYNIIEPTESLEHAVGKLKKQVNE